MEKNGVIFVAVLLCLAAAAAQAGGTIYVDVASPNDPGSGTPEDPFRRIQDAINYAATGDTVVIHPGVYTGPGNHDLDPNGKAITINSTNPDDSWSVASTVIDPNGAGRGFYIHNGEDTNCVISGLTIRNSLAKVGNNGAGIYCRNSNPTISNCVIKNNRAIGGSGGGICLDSSSATVINCSITANSAYYYGGGISSGRASPTITGCTISGNSATFEGGGIDNSQSDTNIFNCIIIDNNSMQGGGINCYGIGVANVSNSTITANAADDVGGGIHCWSQADITIKNSIVWANSATDGTQFGLLEEGAASIVYCDVQGGQADVYDPCGLLLWGQGNMDNDPCFASFDPNGDPNLWDLHLQSKDGRWNPTFYKIDFNKDGAINLVEFSIIGGVWLEQGSGPEDIDNNDIVDWSDLGLFVQYYLTNSYEDGWINDAITSPCVDGGDPNSGWTDERWPNGKLTNMGAYGGTAQASKSGNIADFNIDEKVDFSDFAITALLWDENTAGIEDLTRDGIVNIDDFSIFAENWLWERN